jgi:predicted RNA-binding protein with PUA-like domain
MRYFLAKSEPSSYSIEDLERDNETWWDGVHNYQAINTIKSWKIGDKVYFYRSLKSPAIVGLMEIVSEPVFDLDDKRNISWKAKCKFVKKFTREITLENIKSSKKFDSFALIRNSRLSVMACTSEFVNYVEDISKKL